MKVTLLIIKPNAQNYTNKNLNYETENKATLGGSTTFTLMFLLNGESIKTQVCLLLVPFTNSHVFYKYQKFHNIPVFNELFQALFWHINNWIHHLSIIKV